MFVSLHNKNTIRTCCAKNMPHGLEHWKIASLWVSNFCCVTWSLECSSFPNAVLSVRPLGNGWIFDLETLWFLWKRCAWRDDSETESSKAAFRSCQSFLFSPTASAKNARWFYRAHISLGALRRTVVVFFCRACKHADEDLINWCIDYNGCSCSDEELDDCVEASKPMKSDS